MVQQAEASSAELRLKVQTLEVENHQLRDQLRKTGANLTVTSVDARLMSEVDGTTQTAVETGERGRRTNSRTERATPAQISPARSHHTATPDNPSNRRNIEDDHISEHVESSIQDLGESVASEESEKAEV